MPKTLLYFRKYKKYLIPERHFTLTPYSRYSEPDGFPSIMGNFVLSAGRVDGLVREMICKSKQNGTNNYHREDPDQALA